MRIVPLAAHNPRPWTGPGNHTYLVGHDQPLLIDAGEGHPQHLAALDVALEGRDLAGLLVTHAHDDHIGGARAIVDRHPRVRPAKWPWPARDADSRVSWAPLADDEVIEVDGDALLVVHTPGHSPDHVCLFEPRRGLLFAGDLVVNGGTVAIPVSQGGNLRQYLRSLGRVLDLQPRRILPAHGDPIENPAALLRGYIAHRLARERQIAEALVGALLSVDDLVARVYAGQPGLLPDAAAETVLAHLVKLEEDGRVVRETDAGAPTRWRAV